MSEGNAFGFFKDNEAVNAGGGEDVENGECGEDGGGERKPYVRNEDTDTVDPRPKRPEWLSPVDEEPYITDDHIVEGRKADAVGGKKSSYERRSNIGVGLEDPVRDDIASFAVSKLFRFYTSYLNDSRKNLQKSAFEKLGYLFASWRTVEDVHHIGQASLQLTWNDEYAETKRKIMEDIEGMFLLDPDSPDADEMNENSFKQLVKETPELVLLISHDVLVNTGADDPDRKHTGKEKVKYPYSVHLLEVAARLVGGFSQVRRRGGVSFEVLAAHKNSLNFLYEMAVVLRVMFWRHCVQLPNAEPVRFRSITPDTLHATPKECLLDFLRMLTPGNSTASGVLASVLTAVPKDLYEKNRLDRRAEQTGKGGERTAKKLPKAPLPVDEYSLHLGK